VPILRIIMLCILLALCDQLSISLRWNMIYMRVASASCRLIQLRKIHLLSYLIMMTQADILCPLRTCFNRSTLMDSFNSFYH
jgi:hypothetical protein